MTDAKRPRIPRGLRPDGAALWSYGFRPFFLGGAVWAVVAMVLWIAALIHGLPLGGDYGAPLWHAHEMVFGFAPAVLAGFLLTAIPNWTGSLPVSGRALIGLFSVWAAGRVAMAGAALTGTWAAAAVDAAFLPLLLAIAAREIIAGRKWNDLKVLGGVTAVMAGNLGFHGAVLGGGDPLLTAALTGWDHHPRVAFVSGMNEPLAHRIYAGADAFAMPIRPLASMVSAGRSTPSALRT